MAFQLSLTRVASKVLEHNCFGTPARTNEAAIRIDAFRGGRDFSRRCGLGIPGSVNAAIHGRFAVPMRCATIQGGAAR
jgi:hypothetical protein